MTKTYAVYTAGGKRIRRARKAEVDLYFAEGWHRGEGIVQGYQLAEDLEDWGRVYIL